MELNTLAVVHEVRLLNIQLTRPRISKPASNPGVTCFNGGLAIFGERGGPVMHYGLVVVGDAITAQERRRQRPKRREIV